MHWSLPLEGNEDFPLSYHLGLLGMTGMTAYAGLFQIGRPKEGQTVFVNAAAGAVGQAAVQFAKLCGLNLRVIATAGSPEKLEFLKQIGADVVFNYKDLPKEKGEAEKKLREIAGPKGIDLFFDNVSFDSFEKLFLLFFGS
jgi:NADPH-dependent curcumin reductase CurA